jgi:hypothetical protein
MAKNNNFQNSNAYKSLVKYSKIHGFILSSFILFISFGFIIGSIILFTKNKYNSKTIGKITNINCVYKHNGHLNCDVNYTYKDKNDHSYTSFATLHYRPLNNIITVYYDKNNPNNSSINNNNPHLIAIILLSTGLFLALISIIFIYFLNKTDSLVYILIIKFIISFFIEIQKLFFFI